MLQRRAVNIRGRPWDEQQRPGRLPTDSEKVYPGTRAPTTVRHAPITARPTSRPRGTAGVSRLSPCRGRSDAPMLRLTCRHLP